MSAASATSSLSASGPIFILDEGSDVGVWDKSVLDAKLLMSSLSRDVLTLSAAEIVKEVGSFPPGELHQRLVIAGGNASWMPSIWDADFEHPFVNAARSADRYIGFCAGSVVATTGYQARTSRAFIDREMAIQMNLAPFPVYSHAIKTPGFTPLCCGISAFTFASLAFREEALPPEVSVVERYNCPESYGTDVAAVSLPKSEALPAFLLYGCHPESTVVGAKTHSDVGLEWASEEGRADANKRARAQISQFLETGLTPR